MLTFHFTHENVKPLRNYEGEDTEETEETKECWEGMGKTPIL